jgi:O-antigen/teichoic acid export membrane protein
VLGIFTSLVLILNELVNAKLDMAVMLPEDTAEASSIVDAAYTGAGIFSIFLIIPAGLLAWFYQTAYLLIPLTVWLSGIQQPIVVLLNKTGQYKRISTLRIIQVATTIPATLLLLIVQVPHALIIGFCMGIAAAALFSLRYFQPRFNITLLRDKLREYGQFPRYGTWSALINIPLLLAQFFSSGTVGIYSYATRLLGAPSGLYTGAVGQVYWQAASKEDNRELRKTTLRLMAWTLLLACIPAIAIAVYGQEIFAVLFGNVWREAGKVAQYLILWYVAGLFITPVSVVLDVRNKLSFELKYNIVLFIGRAAAIVAGGLTGNFYVSLLLFVAFSMLMHIYLLYFIYFKVLQDEYQA